MTIQDTGLDIFSYLEKQSPHLLKLLLSIAKIPAPTNKEQRKAEFISAYIQKIGFTDVSTDDIHNCILQLPATAKLLKGAKKKTILISAHMDTACDPGKKVTITEDKKYLYGHGICDNSAGITGVLTTLSLIHKYHLQFSNDLIFAFTVGEEGLGAKRGMKAVVKIYGKKLSGVVNVESHHIGRVTNQAIGQYRCMLAIDTKLGGHSYRDFGRPNANVILASIISDFSHTKVFFQKKKATFNIGQMKGEGSINAIAKGASCLLEIRSEDNTCLQETVKEFIVTTKKYQKRFPKIDIHINVSAETPAVSWPLKDQIFKLTMQAQKELNILSKIGAGNTDGDVSLAAGIPTVTIGTSNGWNTHSFDEYMEKDSLVLGIKQVFHVIQTVATQL